jgi:hypothetical protein
MDNNGNGKEQRAFTVLMPNSAVCFNFVSDSKRLRKSAWFVPHVVRHRDDTVVISWRCNWGNVCESECFYAMAKERERVGPV